MLTTDPIRVSRRSLFKVSAASTALAMAHGIAPGWAGAQGATPGATPARPAADPDFAALSEFVVARMAALGVPGVAIGVVHGGREDAAGFGVTNVDHPLPVDAGTLFQIGSTTKTVTGTAARRLAEAGTLDLDAPVRAYLPEFRVADEAVSERVTVQQLLTHTGGWFGDEFTETGAGDDALARFVAEMADLPQIAPLGELLSYNNAALSVAGRVIEVVTGQPYEAAMTELVLAPLGMERSFFYASEVITTAVAAGHDAPDGTPVVTGPWGLPRAINPAGGIIADARDMLRYARFHLGDGMAGDGRLLSAASMRRMQTPLGPGGAMGPDLLDGVGITWLLSTVDGARLVQHGGSTNGQQSTLVLVPERGFALVVLTNANLGAVLGTEVLTWALGRYLGIQHVPMPEQPMPTTLPAEVTAVYGDPAVAAIDVAERDGELVAIPLAAGNPLESEAVILRFAGGDRFLSDYHGITVYTDIVRDATGGVRWLRFSGRLLPVLVNAG